jgi:serine/threonine-protein kinase
MSGSCPRCGQAHALANCPYGQEYTLPLDPQAPEELGDLRPGFMVGEYRVTGVIGAGGMGKVYAGVHPLIERKVAIKVISRALSGNDEAAARFLQEARAATALHHRNIVDVFAFGKLPDGRYYQVMELLEGETLREVVFRRGALPLPQIRIVTRAILSALDAAHRGGIIHRDIKPDNVFISGALDGPAEEIEVRLLDFGLAKLLSPSPDGPAVVTRLGFPMGTPQYMSPEQCRSTGEIDARADLYAAGVVLYEMLTGRLPFESDGALEVMAMQISEPVPPPSKLAPVAPAVEQVVLRSLAKQPVERYESAAAMLAAFESASAAAPAAVPGRRPEGLASLAPGHALLRAGRGTWWLLALVGGAAAGVVAMRTHPRSPAPVAAPAPAPAPTPPVVEPPPRPTAATVQVSLEPAGRVYLDGKLAGSGAAVTIAGVPFGAHTLRGEAGGYLPEERTVTVDEPVAVAIALKPRRPARKPAAPTRHPRPTHKEADVEAPINPYQR